MVLPDLQMEAYCNYRAQGSNKRKSAIQAGYPEQQAHNRGARLDARQDIQRRIAEIKIEQASHGLTSDATRPWIVTSLIEIVNIGLCKGVVKNTTPTVVKKTTNDLPPYDLANANRALETLAKMGGHMIKESYAYRESLNLSMVTDQKELTAALKRHVADLPQSERIRLLAESPAGLMEVLDLTPEPAES